MNNPIKRKTVNTVFLSTPMKHRKLEMVEVPTIEKFDYAMDRKNPFFKRLMAFIRGENELGRKVGAVLDIATLFLPGAVKTGRDAVKLLITKQNKTMTILKDKAWYESKTIWSAILVLLTGILQAAGVDLAGNPELIETIYVVAYHIAGALGLYGLREALGDKNKPQPEN